LPATNRRIRNPICGCCSSLLQLRCRCWGLNSRLLSTARFPSPRAGVCALLSAWPERGVAANRARTIADGSNLDRWTSKHLFLCGWYRRALAGWHRLVSGLVRPRNDTHCLRSSSDRWAGKCGGKCGVSASDRLRVTDVHGSDDSLRVSQDPPAFHSCAERSERPPEYLFDRFRSNRLVSSLVSRRGDNRHSLLLLSALRRVLRTPVCVVSVL
jgi:hypothetical protein